MPILLALIYSPGQHSYLTTVHKSLIKLRRSATSPPNLLQYLRRIWHISLFFLEFYKGLNGRAKILSKYNSITEETFPDQSVFHTFFFRILNSISWDKESQHTIIIELVGIIFNHLVTKFFRLVDYVVLHLYCTLYMLYRNLSRTANYRNTEISVNFSKRNLFDTTHATHTPHTCLRCSAVMDDIM